MVDGNNRGPLDRRANLAPPTQVRFAELGAGAVGGTVSLRRRWRLVLAEVVSATGDRHDPTLGGLVDVQVAPEAVRREPAVAHRPAPIARLVPIRRLPMSAPLAEWRPERWPARDELDARAFRVWGNASRNARSTASMRLARMISTDPAPPLVASSTAERRASRRRSPMRPAKASRNECRKRRGVSPHGTSAFTISRDA